MHRLTHFLLLLVECTGYQELPFTNHILKDRFLCIHLMFQKDETTTTSYFFGPPTAFIVHSKLSVLFKMFAMLSQVIKRLQLSSYTHHPFSNIYFFKINYKVYAILIHYFIHLPFLHPAVTIIILPSLSLVVLLDSSVILSLLTLQKSLLCSFR